jgi:peptidyl-dipeptidase A
MGSKMRKTPSFVHFPILLAVLAGAMLMTTFAAQASDNDAAAKQFIARHEATIRPWEIESSRCWWEANTTGSDKAFQKKEEIETRLGLLLADHKTFAQLKAIKSQPIADPLVARQVAVLYLQYLGRQIDPELIKEMSARSNAVEKAFSNYRARVDGKELTENQVRDILRTSKDSAQRRAVWEASKAVGPVLAPDLKKLALLRNRAARQLGFKNFHVMQLALIEQSQEQALTLFDELDALTRGPFHAAKAEIDEALARQCGVGVEELRPWHYHDPFFQEAPVIYGDFDSIYRKIDTVKVCRTFYEGIGLPINDVLGRSDLFEKPGKCPHAFSTDIDREGDVRVLANVVPGQEWLKTMLHELGHAAYSKSIPRSVPYVLRIESHPLTTEGVAMMVERLGDNPRWLRAMGVTLPDAEKFAVASHKSDRNRLLIFSRWCQVVFRFEKALYDNPEQDLNRVWWDLVATYQELKRPEGRDQPDYASKIHIATVPVYYQSYMLGQLFASQVHHAIAREVLHCSPASAVYVGQPAVGRFMRERVFEPGSKLDWNELTRHATGEELNSKAFAADLKE